MRRLALLVTGLALAVLGLAPSAHAAFGIQEADVTFTGPDGSPMMQAGTHPFAITTTFDVNTVVDPKLGEVPEGQIKDLRVTLPPGFVGAPTAVPRCSNADFVDISISTSLPACPDASAVGTLVVQVNDVPEYFDAPVYNLVPPPGVAQKFGMVLQAVPVTIEFTVNQEPPYNVIATLRNTSQLVEVAASKLVVWGVPGDPAHDSFRGSCIDAKSILDEFEVATTGEDCPAGGSQAAFLTAPRSCKGPLATGFTATSWQQPGVWTQPLYTFTHDGGIPPAPLGFYDCGLLNFSPATVAKPTARAAQSPTGLDFSLSIEDEGLTSPDGLAQADIAKTVVTLPEGMTVNASIAEGLEVCSEAELAKETAFSDPGEGCPEAAKIGTVEVETPLLEESVNGALYQAAPYENPFGSLIALYMVIKNPNLGIVIKQPLKVESDPSTGRLTTIADDLPELPFSSFRLHFREGARSPLVTPPTCGTHTVEAMLYPSSGGAPVQSNSSFEIVSGPGEGPCPSGGLPPFRPSLLAGTENNAAGSFSPFLVSLSRTDSEQEFTNFSIKLPPGVAGKLAGIPVCNDLQIALAAARTGPHGGQEELDAPSCPAASQVGRTLAGAGVGSALAYAPGKIYLAGPYRGAPISMVSITSGVVGPFDIGTVVVRLAIDVNPETGEVFLDSTGSDPIPHIINGIPVHLRDVRAYTDRPQFTFNPTSCEPTSTSSTVLGSGLDFASPADDNPVVVSTRFQAADCAALRFKPKLSFKLKGSTKRSGNPALSAHVGMNGFGEAAIRFAQVTLPKSEFLDQSHIGTVCTRVQFREGEAPGEKCPAASVYGKVSARTPILDGPLSGPIFLRSSENPLPDLVASLHHGQIDIVLVGRIDTGKGGGIRNTFEFVPDAPVTSADFRFFGGKKGLLDNSRNLCKGVNKVRVLLKAHSGRRVAYKTPLKPLGCKGKKKAKRSAKRRP